MSARQRSAARRFKEPPAFLAATVTAFLAIGAAGCSSEPDQYVHCIDENGQVVDPELCEDEEYDDDHYGGGTHWYYVSTRRYSVGSSVPSDHTSNRIHPSDGTARANAGIPRTGSAGGTTIRGGGFGSGSGYSGGGYRGGGS